MPNLARLSGCLPAVLLALAVSMPAAAQEEKDYENKGFYQSYIFGAPDKPSEAWLLAYGGRLYDMWWAVLFVDPPESTHPSYPEDGSQSGPTTWRCVECHGWDYRGKDGYYAEGEHATGITGIRSMAGADPADVAKILRDSTHRYSAAMIPDDALETLALFVSKGQVDMPALVDAETGKVRGNAERGQRIFQNLCAICHDFDGQAWITGEEDGLSNIGQIAVNAPWRALHKIMNGQTYADMPALRALDLDTVLDVLAYSQTLPQE